MLPNALPTPGPELHIPVLPDEVRELLAVRPGDTVVDCTFGGALECDLDRQGRVALPAPLIGHASLDREIVIAGLRDRLEIWDRESWRRQLANVEGSAEVVAERIANARP